MKKRWEYDLNLQSCNPTISGNQSKHSSWLTTLIFHSENPLENYGIQLPPSPLEIPPSPSEFPSPSVGQVWIFSGTTCNISILRRTFPYYGIGQNYGNRIFRPFSAIFPKYFHTMEEVECFQCCSFFRQINCQNSIKIYLKVQQFFCLILH